MKDLVKFDVWNGIKSVDNRFHFTRVSRWLKVKFNYNPVQHNKLWDYVTDENGYHPYESKFNPDNGLELIYFTFNGVNYPVECIVFGGCVEFTHSCGYIENGEQHYLTGYTDNNIYNSLYLEFDEDCEHVRVYECVNHHVFDAYEHPNSFNPFE